MAGACILTEVLDLMIGQQMNVDTVTHYIEMVTDENHERQMTCVDNLTDGVFVKTLMSWVTNVARSSVCETRRRVFSQPGLSNSNPRPMVAESASSNYDRALRVDDWIAKKEFFDAKDGALKLNTTEVSTEGGK